jgi:hypothetical protein
MNREEIDALVERAEADIAKRKATEATGDVDPMFKVMQRAGEKAQRVHELANNIVEIKTYEC